MVNSQCICEFIAWLSLQRYSPATISIYVAGVSCHFKLKGEPDPTDYFVVAKMLEGARRSSNGKDRRVPISPSVLSRIIAALPKVSSSSFEAKLFRAAMLLAFFGFLRVGEFAANSRDKVQSSVLQLEDIAFTSGRTHAQPSLILTMHHTKTNQQGPPSESIFLSRLHLHYVL